MSGIQVIDANWLLTDQLGINPSFFGGHIEGFMTVQVSGKNPAASTAIEDVIGGGGLISWPQSAGPIAAISTSALDATATSGAHTLIISGLDVDFEPITEVLTMNGDSASIATSQSFLRVNDTRVQACGTYGNTITGANIGTISVTNSASQVFSTILNDGGFDFGRAQMAKYTVRANWTAFLVHIQGFVEGNKNANITAFVRPEADNVTSPFTAKFAIAHFDGILGKFDFTYEDHPIQIEEKSDIWVSTLATQAAEVGASFGLVCLRNTL